MHTHAPLPSRVRRPRLLLAALAGSVAVLASTTSAVAAPTAASTAAPTASTSDRPAAHHGGQWPTTLPLPVGLRPEGITSHGTRYYVGSLTDGRIVTGDLRRAGTRELLPGATGRQIRGLGYDV